MVYVIDQKINTVDWTKYLSKSFVLSHPLNQLIFDKLDPLNVSRAKQLCEIYSEIIEEGETYPAKGPVTFEDFNSYYLSGDTFILYIKETDEIVGSFYVKPNFPGRSSHICNGGFMVKKCFRGMGVGKILVKEFEFVAPILGYKASFFNLVYKSNLASVKLWENNGFLRTGVVPNAANLKTSGWTDAYQYYKEFSRH